MPSQFIGSDFNDPGVPPAPAGEEVSLPFGYIYGLKVNWASNSTVTVEAGECRSSDDTGNIVLSDQVTVNIAASGELGKSSAAAEANNTWYYVWVWSKANGTSTASIDVSESSPTDPLGGATYIYKRLLCAIRNDGSSNFIQFVMSGSGPDRLVEYLVPYGTTIVEDLVGTTYADVDCSAFVPSIATKAWIAANMYNEGGATRVLSISPSGQGVSEAGNGVFVMTGENLGYRSDETFIHPGTGRILRADLDGGIGGGGICQIYIRGWITSL